MQTLIVGIIAIIISVIGGFVQTPGIAIIAMLVAITAQYLQYKDSLPYELLFAEDDWTRQDDSFFIQVGKNIHKKSAPTVFVYMKTDDNRYTTVECVINTDNDGKSTICANNMFIGKLIIK